MSVVRGVDGPLEKAQVARRLTLPSPLLQAGKPSASAVSTG